MIIKVAKTFEECQVLCTQIFEDVDNGLLFLGFDTETKIGKENDKVDVIQVAYTFNGNDKGFIFQLSKLTEVPRLLIKLLQSNVPVKIGVNIIFDVEKIYKSFNINCKSFIDLQSLAITFGIPKTSLNDLGQIYIDNFNQKDPNGHLGKWDDELTLDNQMYAIRDAHLCYLIYIKMMNEKILIKHIHTNILDDDNKCFLNWTKLQIFGSPNERTFNSIVNQALNSYGPWRNKYIEFERKQKISDSLKKFINDGDLKFDQLTMKFCK